MATRLLWEQEIVGSSPASRIMGNVKKKAKRIQIAIRDGLKCSRCDCRLRFPNTPKDKRKTALLSHELPKSCGGTDANKNLTLICGDCEALRHKEYLSPDIRVKGEFCEPESYGVKLKLKLA